MVTSINVTDHDGVSRSVATLDSVSVTEDAAAASDPVGINMMARRRDSLVTNEVSATGDAIALNASSRGELHVNIAAHAANPAKAEDAAHTTADVGMAILGVRRDTAASGADTDGDYATVNLDANGRLYTNPTPTPGAAVAAKAEDAAHTSADVGNFVLAVRADSPAVTGQTDGDYSAFIVDANGRLYTNAIVVAGATSIAKAEDAAHSTGETGVYVLGVRRDTSATTATTDGDYSSFTLDANGKLWSRIGADDTLYTEDAAAASDPVGRALIAVRRDTLSASEVSGDGDNVALKADSRGRLHVAEDDLAKLKAFAITVAPTVTAGAYTAGDHLGGKQTITAAGRASGAGGRLKSITMTTEGGSALVDTIEVYIFSADPSSTTVADNDPMNIHDDDLPKLIGSYILNKISDTGDGFVMHREMDQPYVCSGSANLFALAIHRGTWAPDATDGISFRYHVVRD